MRTTMLVDQLAMIIAAAEGAHSPAYVARQSIELYRQVGAAAALSRAAVHRHMQAVPSL